MRKKSWVVKMTKRYYVCESDLSIIEVSVREDTTSEFDKEKNFFDTYKEALEKVIKMHDEAMEAALHRIEELVLNKQKHNRQLAKVLLDNTIEKEY